MLLVLVWGGHQEGLAGGGPENVLLVVNPSNFDSLTIANHYVQLRQIPASNVFHLDWSSAEFETDLETAREQILRPVFQEIAKRQLGRQIDYVVYSAGYPYAVNFAEVAPASTKFAKASLTGLTYLHEYVLQGSLLFKSPTANFYMRHPDPSITLPTQGFRARYGFDLRGRRRSEGGRRYVLSMMLGYTGGSGNRRREVIDYLERSARADGTLPRGTIYYVRNDDVRSRARHDHFDRAVAELARLGVRAEVVPGVLPRDKQDVQGVTMGAARFDWPASGSRILPGAIGDNFTSFGGVLRGNSQTLLCEFLRQGAAGACGTVVEPYAIPQKFPHPMIHVHYARGCSLAEAFYQSVYGPYQQLLVGDPLCQPWARAPQVRVSGLEPGQRVREAVTLAPVAIPAAGRPVRRFEFFVDGVLATQSRPGETARFDSRKLADGYHELRVVAIEDSEIEVQGRATIPFFSANSQLSIDCRVTPAAIVPSGEEVTVAIQCAGAESLLLFHNHRQIASVEGDRGQLRIDSAALGSGPVRLQAVGKAAGDAGRHVFSAPLYLQVQPPAAAVGDS
jgi:hypothetical protein